MVNEKKEVTVNVVSLKVGNEGYVDITSNDEGKFMMSSQQDSEEIYMNAKQLKEVSMIMEKLNSGVI